MLRASDKMALSKKIPTNDEEKIMDKMFAGPVGNMMSVMSESISPTALSTFCLSCEYSPKNRNEANARLRK